MRQFFILSCLALTIAANVPATRAESAEDVVRSSLSHDIDLAERAARDARDANAARDARKAEDAARAEAAAKSAAAAAAAADAAARAQLPVASSVAAAKQPPLPRRGRLTPASEAASAWTSGHQSRVRMIAGDIDFASRGWSFAGVQMQLATGWKTYWRTPGDTGVPPTFDWSGSRNLKSAEVLYPVPHKYHDAYSTSVGYKREVVLPVRIVAVDPSKPVEVKLRFGYGLCEQICVPGEVDLHLVMPSRQRGHSDLLAQFTSKVPTRVSRVGESSNGFAIDQVEVELNGPAPAITIDARVPDGIGASDLFIEASDNFYLPLPIEQPSPATGQRRFRIDLTKADPAAELAGHTLALTLVGDDSGIEYHHKIN